MANHHSYLDGILMVGLIAPPFRIVTTRTVLEHPISRVIVPRLPVMLVSSTAAENVQVVAAMAEALKKGERIPDLPGRAQLGPGGQAVRASARSRAAAEAQVPVIPIAIDGASRRRFRRAASYPGPGKLAATICPVRARRLDPL